MQYYDTAEDAAAAATNKQLRTLTLEHMYEF